MKVKILNSPKTVSKSNNDRPFSKKNAKDKYFYCKVKEKLENISTFQNPVESKIRKAMNDGLFNNLTHKGQPIDLKNYFAIPENLRLAYHILKNSNYLPEEIRLKKKIEHIKEEIQISTSDKRRKELNKTLVDTEQYFAFCMEYNRKK